MPRLPREKPVVHSRDHEHGGADTIRIHYEDVGDGGSGGGGTIVEITSDDDSVTIVNPTGPVVDLSVDTGGGGGGDGIQFDLYPQSGGYLHIDTTTTSTEGLGIHLQSSENILIESESASYLQGNQVTLATGGMHLDVYPDALIIGYFGTDLLTATPDGVTFVAG